MSNFKKNKWFHNNIDSLVDEIEYNRITTVWDEDLADYDKLLLFKIKKLMKDENKSSILNEEKIQNFFNKLVHDEVIGVQSDSIIELLFKYIINNYETEAYQNKQFVFHIPDMEYGIDIASYKISSSKIEKNSILDGVSTFIHPQVEEGIPFHVLSYKFYKNGKLVKNYLEETFSQGINYSINNKNIYSDNEDRDEILYPIFKEINNKINLYPWLQKLIDSNEDIYKLVIIDDEKTDKIKFKV
jgi:hypothetical protein